LLASAAFAAGAINAVAGGGTFLTFPALIVAGIPSIAANATSTAAVCPGALASAFAYRRDVAGLGRRFLLALIAISLIGGLLGALLLLWTPETTFARLIPWLLLGATLLFAGGRRVAQMVRARIDIGPTAILLGQLFIAIYGGYFGGGVSILMLGMMTVAGYSDVNQMNGIKALLSGCLNAVAVVTFALAHEIVWRPAAIMAVAAVAGGYAGGAIARRVDPTRVRALVIVIGVAMTAYFFVRAP
jgi:uncharacterized membrane protein YfcA